MTTNEHLICGHTFEALRQAQQGNMSLIRPVIQRKTEDYGADPLGYSIFRMVPSGDIVDRDERNRRLSK